MLPGTSTIFELTLPNAMTWAYMGFVLIVMLFFRFSRPLQLRNLDILLLLILAPPLLSIRDVQDQRDCIEKVWKSQSNLTGCPPMFLHLCAVSPLHPAHALAISTVGVEQIAWTAHEAIVSDGRSKPVEFRSQEIWQGYLWLLISTAVLLARSLVDLGMERRSTFQANLTAGGMIWLILVLLLVMTVKSFHPAWGGIPKQQHRSIVMIYLMQSLATHTVIVSSILALVCHTIVVVLLAIIGLTIFRSMSVGVAAGLLYLLVPYTALYLLDASQVVTSVLVLTALLCYRWPIWAGLCLGVGTCLGFFPAILVPVWFGFYFRRGHGRFLVTYLSIILAVVIYLALAFGLSDAWRTAWELTEWQAWKFARQPLSDGLWNSISLHFAYRIPLFIVFVALVILSGFWPHPKNVGQLISWTAVLILGVQFWYADAGGTYILWYLPFLILQAVRPSLIDHRPPLIDEEKDRIRQLIRWSFSFWRKKPAADSTVSVEKPAS